MNRRELLRLIGLGVVGHTLDIDKLLWVSGQKTIFLPSNAQQAFYGGMAGDGKSGIMYHSYVYSTGQWIDTIRNQNAMNDLVSLILKLEENKIR